MLNSQLKNKLSDLKLDFALTMQRSSCRWHYSSQQAGPQFQLDPLCASSAHSSASTVHQWSRQHRWGGRCSIPHSSDGRVLFPSLVTFFAPRNAWGERYGLTLRVRNRLRRKETEFCAMAGLSRTIFSFPEDSCIFAILLFVPYLSLWVNFLLLVRWKPWLSLSV